MVIIFRCLGEVHAHDKGCADGEGCDTTRRQYKGPRLREVAHPMSEAGGPNTEENLRNRPSGVAVPSPPESPMVAPPAIPCNAPVRSALDSKEA
jgi:hypothetical protein